MIGEVIFPITLRKHRNQTCTEYRVSISGALSDKYHTALEERLHIGVLVAC